MGWAFKLQMDDPKQKIKKQLMNFLRQMYKCLIQPTWLSMPFTFWRQTWRQKEQQRSSKAAKGGYNKGLAKHLKYGWAI